MSGRRRHGRRRHVATWCPCRCKMCFTTYDAAMAAVCRVPGAERAYRSSCCGHWHITGYTMDEYAQLMAERSVQVVVEYGTVVLYDDEGQDHEAEHDAGPDAGDDGEEQGADAGGPRPSPVERRSAPPVEAATPARLAEFLASRGRR